MIPTGILDESFAIWIIIHRHGCGTSDKKASRVEAPLYRTVGPTTKRVTATLITMSWSAPPGRSPGGTSPRHSGPTSVEQPLLGWNGVYSLRSPAHLAVLVLGLTAAAGCSTVPAPITAPLSRTSHGNAMTWSADWGFATAHIQRPDGTTLVITGNGDSTWGDPESQPLAAGGARPRVGLVAPSEG